MRRLAICLLLLAAGCHYDNLINIDLRKCDCEKGREHVAPDPVAQTRPADSTPPSVFDLLKGGMP